MMGHEKKEGGGVFTRILGGREAPKNTATNNTKEYYNLPEGNSQMLMEVENSIFMVCVII